MEHRKILVVDDEEIIQQVATKMLQKLGFEVQTACDGKSAVECYKKAQSQGEPFHAVIIDLTLSGGMGGKQTFEKLKQIDPHIQAIVSSGNLFDPVFSDYKYYGFTGAVKKPFKFSEFKETILKQR